MTAPSKPLLGSLILIPALLAAGCLFGGDELMEEAVLATPPTALSGPVEELGLVMVSCDLRESRMQGRSGLLLEAATLQPLDRTGAPIHTGELEGRMFVFPALAPGEYVLTRVYGRRAGSKRTFAVDMPAHAGFVLRVREGEVLHVGLVQAWVDRPRGSHQSAVLQSSPARERGDWSRLLDHFPGSPWEALIRLRLESLPSSPRSAGRD